MSRHIKRDATNKISQWDIFDWLYKKLGEELHREGEELELISDIILALKKYWEEVRDA